MSNIKLSLFQGNSDIEDSQLRSILLFGEFAKEKDKEKYLMQRAIMSIIVQMKGACTIEKIRDILANKFSLSLKNKEISKHVNSLVDDKLVLYKDGNLVAITEQKEGDAFFERLNQETDVLIGNICNRYTLLHGKNDSHRLPVIKNNIRRALSVYYKMAGYKYFKIKKNDSKNLNAIETAFDGLGNEEGKHLVTAIADTIKNPTEDELKILEKWGKAYILTQILQLDPTLASFRQDKLRKKSFVIDTDVLLNAITTYSQYSKDYREALTYLRDLKSELYVPKEVLRDIRGHAEQAIQIVNETGEEQVREFDDFILESTSFNNVFITDYVNKVRREPDCHNLHFDSYIGNIYYAKDDAVLLECLGEIIGLHNLTNELPKVELNDETKAKLRDLILQKTVDSPKGANRSDNFNAKVAEDDAKLYLTINHCNTEAKKQSVIQDTGLMPEKFYFLTQSTKIERSAKQLDIYTTDIICHPAALITAIQELGEIPEGDVEIINLFENPFLVFAADDIWKRVEPLLNSGERIYHEDTRLLRAKVNVQFDDMLTCKDEADKVELAKKYRSDGFKFPSYVVALSELYKKSQEENKEKDAALAKEREENEKLKKRVNKERHELRLKNLRDKKGHKKQNGKKK